MRRKTDVLEDDSRPGLDWTTAELKGFYKCKGSCVTRSWRPGQAPSCFSPGHHHLHPPPPASNTTVSAAASRASVSTSQSSWVWVLGERQAGGSEAWNGWVSAGELRRWTDRQSPWSGGALGFSRKALASLPIHSFVQQTSARHLGCAFHLFNRHLLSTYYVSFQFIHSEIMYQEPALCTQSLSLGGATHLELSLAREEDTAPKGTLRGGGL